MRALLLVGNILLLFLLAHEALAMTAEGFLRQPFSADFASPEKDPPGKKKAEAVCHRMLMHQHVVRLVSNEQELVRAAREWFSPSFVMASLPGGEYQELLSRYDLPVELWRALSAKAFEDFVRVEPELEAAKAVVLQAMFSRVVSVQVPADPRLLRRWRDALFGRRATVLESLEPLDDVLKELWKLRQNIDLRELNPDFFQAVVEQRRFNDTFNANVRRLLEQFEIGLPVWPRTWGEWLNAVNNFIKTHFQTTSPAERRMLITFLERAFLQVPPPPPEGELLSAIAALERPEPSASPGANATAYSYSLTKNAKRDLQILQPAYRRRVEEFFKIVEGSPNPVEQLKNGSWQYEKIKQAGEQSYSVRVNRGIRILFRWIADKRLFEITNIDSKASHSGH